MARLIDAKVLERQIKATFKDSNPVLMGQMLRWVRCQTTIDAVPVIRCKDCKFWECGTCKLHSEEPDQYSVGLSVVMMGTDFCSYGERKDND